MEQKSRVCYFFSTHPWSITTTHKVVTKFSPDFNHAADLIKLSVLLFSVVEAILQLTKAKTACGVPSYFPKARGLSIAWLKLNYNSEIRANTQFSIPSCQSLSAPSPHTSRQIKVPGGSRGQFFITVLETRV